MLHVGNLRHHNKEHLELVVVECCNNIEGGQDRVELTMVANVTNVVQFFVNLKSNLSLDRSNLGHKLY